MLHFRSFLVSALLPASVTAQVADSGPAPPVENATGATESSSGAAPRPSSATEIEEDSIPLKQPSSERGARSPDPDKSAGDAARAESNAEPADPSAGARPRARSTSDSRGERATAEDDDKDEDEEAQQEESPQFGYLALGPAMLSISGYEEYGFAIAGGGRFPLHEKIALNAGVTWGLTTFDRTGEWWEEARKVGSWTTRAYGNVTKWAGEGDEDDEVFRYMAAFYAYIGLLFPYAVSGIMYVLGPIAATSYIDFHMEATFHLLETRKGPYAGIGLGTAAVIYPVEGDMKGAFGPSFNLGFDFGWFGIEARGFYSPPYLHGEPGLYRTDIFTGQFLFRFQGT